MRVALVTNLCTHYRRPLFEELRRRLDVSVFFTSDGSEWYWPADVDASGRDLAAAPGRRGLVRALARGRYDCVIASLTGRASLAGIVAAARARGIPLVLWVGIWAHPRTPFHRVSRPVVRRLYRAADALLVYGAHVARHIAAESGRTAEVFVAPQAVDNERFLRRPDAAAVRKVRERHRLAGPVVAFVGRLEHGKGLDVLLRASAATPVEHTLLLVGNGTLEPALRTLAEELGLAGRVRFAGRVSQDALPAYLHASAVAVLPSVTTRRFKEPWGLVVNEAMCCGLPVVATDAVGAAAGGLVRDGETGLVVPERDPSALAAALGRLCADARLRVSLGEAARRAVAAYTFAAAADAFEQAVAAAVARRRATRSREPACVS